jgi:hypothetical protein
VLKVVSHFLSHSSECRADFAGALQGSFHVRQHVLPSDVLDEVRFLQQLGRLIARAAQQ